MAKKYITERIIQEFGLIKTSILSIGILFTLKSEDFNYKILKQRFELDIKWSGNQSFSEFESETDVAGNFLLAYFGNKFKTFESLIPFWNRSGCNTFAMSLLMNFKKEKLDMENLLNYIFLKNKNIIGHREELSEVVLKHFSDELDFITLSKLPLNQNDSGKNLILKIISESTPKIKKNENDLIGILTKINQLNQHSNHSTVTKILLINILTSHFKEELINHYKNEIGDFFKRVKA